MLSSDIRSGLFKRLVDGVSAGGNVDNFEGQMLDCKEDPTCRGRGGTKGRGEAKSDETAKVVGDAIACFASAAGGVVVLGVDDKATGQAAFVGTPADTAWLRNRIRQLINTEVDVQEHQVVDSRIVTVSVEPSPVPVSDTSKRYRRRHGRDCHEMTARELGEFSLDRTTSDWSAAPTLHRSSDASVPAIEQLRKWLRATNEASRQELADSDTETMLRSLGLIGADGRLNRAGELLVIELPGREALVDLSCRAAPGADTEHRVDPGEAPLALVLAEVEAAIRDRLPTFEFASGLVVGRLSALPERMVRESLVNAVMHRDWAQRQAIRVELEGLQLTVTSPGGFMPGVSNDTVITVPAKTRNPKLASAMRALRLAEQEGSGIDRMFRDAISVGLPKPDIDQTAQATAVRCALIGDRPDRSVIAVVRSLGQPAETDIDVLLILDVLENQPTVNATALQSIIQKSHASAVSALRRAHDAALVTETSRLGHYRLTDTHRKTLAGRLPYLRRGMNDYAAIIRGVLAEHAEIKARDIIEHAGVSPVTASRILGAAVESGVLVKHPSPQAVGAGVYYTAR